MLVHCEPYLCNINRLENQKKLSYMDSLQNTVIIYCSCQDSVARFEHMTFHFSALPNVLWIIEAIVDLYYSKEFEFSEIEWIFFI